MAGASVVGLREEFFCASMGATVLKKTKNRRDMERRPVAWRGTLKDLDTQLSVSIINISMGGVYVVCENPPECWDNVELTLNIDGETEPIRATGVVVWRVTQSDNKEGAMPKGAGVQFVHIKKADLQRLRTHFDKLETTA